MLVGGANGDSEIVKMWKDYFKGILNSENSANGSVESVEHSIDCKENYLGLSTMGVSKESISKFLIGNRFHVKLRILSPENCKQSLQVKS